MKTTKKQKKSNLKVSLLLLLLAAVLLISSTYAWFVTNDTAKVSTINVKVETVEGLQISTDAAAWKAEITNADITGAGGTYPTAVNQLPAILKPVSSVGTITAGKQEMFLGNVIQSTNPETATEYALTATPETDTHGTTGNYIAFDMFLNLQASSSKDLYLTTASGVRWDQTRAEADSNAAYQTQKYLERASRISFIVIGHAATADAATAQGWTYNAADTDNCGYYLWEPNADQHSTDASNNAVQGANTPLYTAENLATTPVPYSGVKATITETDNVILKNANVAGYSTKFAAVTPTLFTIENFTARAKLLTLKPGITKIRCYMWIEGQDADCFTGASGTYLNWDLQFEVDTVTG